MPLGSLRFRIRKERWEAEQALLRVVVSFSFRVPSTRWGGTSGGRRPQASSPLTCDHIRAPDDAKIKDKMLFASSHEAFKHRLDGVGFEVQATDRSEVSHEIGSSLAPEDTVIS